MDARKAPFLRIFIALVIIGIFFSIPLREFFKITFIFGIPFIFIAGFMIKRRLYSFSWFISIGLLLVILVGYGYTLTTLPDRLEVKTIIREAMSYEAQGKYDEAIKEYRKLETYGKTKKMEERIASAEEELKGQEIIKEAQQYIAKGDKITAKKLLKTVPTQTRNVKEAKVILKELERE